MAKKRLKWKHISGILKWGLTLIPAYLAKPFLKNVWLIEEDGNEARDNGFWMFKYIRENHPKQKCFYVLNKKSPDYEKVAKLGKVIKPNSFSHWFWYIVATKNIVSQTAGRPCAAFTKTMEKKGIFKTKTYFLQHGIIANDMPWLYGNNNKFKLFVTSARKEYEFIKERYGYPEGVVQLLGIPRLDGLHENVIDENMILVMPTWRNYIKNSITKLDKNQVDDQDFVESDFYKCWKAFLESNELNKFLEKNKKTLYFYPHRNMQKYMDEFDVKSKNIQIANAKTNDIQDLLKRCVMLITDYSSVMFDVAYQKKPVICYQFDYETFRKGQHKEGYLHYEDNLLAVQTKTLEQTLNQLEAFNKENYMLSKEQCKKIDEFFPLNDAKNCERVYEAIKNI